MNNCEQHCDCVFSKEEIERLVALCEEDGYTVPRGLTREERRKYMKDVGRPKCLLTKEQLRRISERTLQRYLEASSVDFKPEDFIDLTNVQKESEVNNG